MTARPDSRLISAMAYVRQDALLADIGTDHAYLPVFLCQAGRIRRAYACDIAAGPCERARVNIAKANLTDRISVLQTDGFSGLAEKGITDFTVCGMGGELIASLIEKAPWLKSSDLRLILLPMTKAPFLRSYLTEQGFSIEDETLSEVAGKLYACFCVSYTGTPDSLSPIECELGRANLAFPSPLLYQMAKNRLRAAEKRLLGKENEGDRALAQELRRIIDDCQRALSRA